MKNTYRKGTTIYKIAEFVLGLEHNKRVKMPIISNKNGNICRKTDIRMMLSKIKKDYDLDIKTKTIDGSFFVMADKK